LDFTMQVDLVQVTTRDGVRLDGTYQPATAVSALSVDAVCMVHGTGGNFYGSTLFDELAALLMTFGCSVLRINTRGHDGISTAMSRQGGRRLGAAYELVDDCRHDLTAWIDWLKQQKAQRIGLIGHSLGAVKCLYALAHEPTLAVQCVIAISPPRLSYSWFCANPEAPLFLETFGTAEQRMTAGEPNALIDVKVPLPIAITAAGYVEKYGSEERYNFVNFAASVPCSSLITFGSVEMANNMAFRGSPEAIANLGTRARRITVETIDGADHFYSGVRGELIDRIEAWLRSER
jgi:alpha/beta superfamily hydrolase